MSRAALAAALLGLAAAGCRGGGKDAVPPPPARPVDASPGGAASPAAAAPSGAASPAAAPPSGAAPAERCAAPGPSAPRWYDRAVGYEIFVRSFYDADGDGIGDLDGLTARLDYLNDGDPATGDDLGVDLLWLMPIHESPSYHGYDVTDYRKVEPDYGDDAALDRFLGAARQRGIRVVADLVLNHSSSEHPWFLDAMKGPGAPHRDWYVWSSEPKDWDRPWGPGPTWHRARGSGKAGDWYYALFWEGMPDLNYGSPAVPAEMIDVARHWIDRGFAGYRLDAARYLVETGGGEGQADTAPTHAFWRELHRALAAKRPDVLLVGEVWTDNAVVASYYGAEGAPELDMLFDFDTASAASKALREGDADVLADALCARLEGFPPGASVGTFLTNHDIDRLATRLEATGEAGLRLAAGLLLTLPGTPWIYYGQEIGMRNGAPVGGDEPKRLPMQWAPGEGAGFTAGTPWLRPRDTALERTVTGQARDPRSLLALYRRLVRVRQASPALSVGATRRLEAMGTSGDPLVLRREAEGEVVVVVYHLGAEPSAVTVAAAGLPAGATQLTDLVRRVTYTRERGGDLVLADVEPRGFRVLRVDP